MPKKTRKMKQRSTMRRSMAEGQPEGATTSTPQAAPTLAPRAVLSPANRGVITPATYDYSHIYGDLRRIALFAGFFFVVLIALSFVIK